MLAFILRSHLRTSFNIYLMNLATANFLYALIQNPPDVINHLYNGWFLGSFYCSVLIFGLYIFEAGIRNCHILISLNRIWAVFWPHSYRTYHKKRVACLLCLAGWVEVQFIILPGYILDAMYYRSTAIGASCGLNAMAQWEWSVAIQFTVYNMGLYLMWISYPIIWYKRRQRQRNQIVPSRQPAQSSQGTGARSVRSVRTNQDATDNDTVDDEEETAKTTRSGNQSGPLAKKTSSKAFTILTVLTISVTVCWTPILCYYTITLWMPVNNPILLEVGTVLFALQSVLDPVLFIIALPDLRDTFRGAFRAALRLGR
ncbi:hypothetical protein BV898_13747 [Hypsibius exemplaris]|uniref:G-protein coupled receptors family 1 profile domain-containing protein n=1 Tax=Hypsibius exemplaris TaxID=2072580 RepID=A0A1W0W9X2_HYPEX|nr:hypothetical protein BV898_13747 [Hypsibius exemplaris]